MKKIIISIVVIVLIIIVWSMASGPKTENNGQVATTATPSSTVSPLNSVTYICDAGKTIEASFYEKNIALKLSDGRSLSLPMTISASGVRYSDMNEDFVFSTKGTSAMVLEKTVEKDFKGCIAAAAKPVGSDLSKIYANSTLGFSFRVPEDFKVDAVYAYKGLGAGKEIKGVKFAIPATLAKGTNLSEDTYVSVEVLPKAKTPSCDAKFFLPTGKIAVKSIQVGDTYSIASTTEAAAGTRIEDTVYAMLGSNPCIAVRYSVRYGVLANYPAGSVKEFDKAALLAKFEQIRSTLVLK